MGKVVFLYRSLAYRNAAADILRKARKLPRGAERSAACRYAKALRDLAQTEAWLEGRVAREPQTTQRRKRAASGYRAEGCNWGELAASKLPGGLVAAFFRSRATRSRHNGPSARQSKRACPPS